MLFGLHVANLLATLPGSNGVVLNAVWLEYLLFNQMKDYY